MKIKAQTKLDKVIGIAGLLLICFAVVMAIPAIIFVDPTPADNTITSNTSVEIYVNWIEANLKSALFNWNRTNYSVFDPDLVLAMNFNNLSALGENDTHVFDISGNGNNGTVTGATWTSDGKYDGGHEFDGVNDRIPLSNSVIGNSINHTFSMWAKPSEASNLGCLISDTLDLATSNLGIAIYEENGGWGISLANGTAYIRNSAGGLYHNKDEWSYLTFVIRQNNASLFVDGVNRKTVDITGYNDLTSSTILTIGREGTQNRRYFNGTLDELRIWNKTLTDSEIQQNYLMNLKKYDLDKWSLYVNQSIKTINLTSSNPEEVFTYYSCATNSTNSENCTFIRTITRQNNANITSNFSSNIGNIRKNFYGANVHDNRFSLNHYMVDTDFDGVTDNYGNYTEHSNAFLNSRMNYQRGDMALNNHYDGVENPSFEYWENKNLTYITSVTFDLVRGWGLQDALGGAWISPSTDTHSGDYSLNITCNKSSVYLWNYFQDTQKMALEDYKTYNASIWVKGDGTFTISFQNMETWGSCGTNTFTITSGDGWVQKSVNCNTTTVSSSDYRFVLDGINTGENILVDDFNLQENGEDRNWWKDGNSLNSFISLAKWANENNIKIMPIASYMPTWLANMNANCSSSSEKCPPYNADLFGEITVDWINRTTSNGTYSHVYEIEVWNEPDWSFFMPDLPTDDIQKSIEYNKIYNATYDAIKLAFPNMPVGGTAQAHRTSSTMMNGFLSNFSNKMDFLSFHRYSDTADTTINEDIEAVLTACNTYGANCSRIILSEWQLSGGGYDETDDFISNVMASTYAMGLNNYPSNLTFITYQWTASCNYSTGSSEFPSYWSMFIESQINNGTAIFRPQYNTTKKFATLCPPQSTVYTSTSTTNDLVAVTCKKGNMHNTIVINKGDEAINLTLNLENFTESTIYNMETRTPYTVTDNQTNIGVIDQYEIIYLGLDEQAPSITINSPSNTSYTDNTTYFNLTLDEEGDTCYYSLDGASNISMNKQGVVTQFKSSNTSMTDGSHTVVFYCNDTWDNWETANVTFLIDTTNPVINLTLLNNTYSNESLNNFTSNLTDNIGLANATIKIYNSIGSLVNETTIQLASAVQYTWELVVDLSDDVYTWFIELFDNAGNHETSENYTLTVDSNYPVIEQPISPVDDSTSDSSDINFTANLTDDVGVENITLYIYNSTGDLINETTDTFPSKPKQTIWSKIVTLVDGVYTWFISIFDTAGNEDSTVNRTITLESNLTIRLKLDENSTTTAHDVSANENHATLINSTWGNDGVLVTLTSGEYSTTESGVFTITSEELSWTGIYTTWIYDNRANSQNVNMARLIVIFTALSILTFLFVLVNHFMGEIKTDK